MGQCGSMLAAPSATLHSDKGERTSAGVSPRPDLQHICAVLASGLTACGEECARPQSPPSPAAPLAGTGPSCKPAFHLNIDASAKAVEALAAAGTAASAGQPDSPVISARPSSQGEAQVSSLLAAVASWQHLAEPLQPSACRWHGVRARLPWAGQAALASVARSPPTELLT